MSRGKCIISGTVFVYLTAVEPGQRFSGCGHATTTAPASAAGLPQNATPILELAASHLVVVGTMRFALPPT